MVSFLKSLLALHPGIQPLPPPMHPSVQSVPWRLAATHGRTITANWSSGTCVLKGPPPTPAPQPRDPPTDDSVTITVLVHVVKANGGACVGVGLGGSLHATLKQALDSRPLDHGVVTDHDD